MVPALVLTAGLATRLRPLSLVRAKAAVPMAGTPLVHRILRWLSAGGVTDAVLNLHHLPHTITTLVGDGSQLGLRVRYSWEHPVLGSAGGPKRALPLLQNPAPRTPHSAHGTQHPEPSTPNTNSEHEPGTWNLEPGTFLIVNGDTLTDLAIPALLADHRASGALVTMAVTPNEEPDRYGGVAVDGDGTVTGFVRRGSRESSWHFVGVQAARPEAFDGVPDDTPYETVARLYPDLIAARPGAVRAHRTRAEFLDVGTPGDYLASALRLAGRETGARTAGTGTRVAPSARVERSVLWDDVDVEDGAFLRECVVADGVRVPAGTSWHGVTIRRAGDELAPGERRVEDLAIASL